MGRYPGGRCNQGIGILGVGIQRGGYTQGVGILGGVEVGILGVGGRYT